jgi:hypothetical protein
MLGGAGNDVVNFNATTDGSDTVDLGEGDDRVNVSGAAGQIRLTFTSAEIGNGNPNDTSRAGSTSASRPRVRTTP